jgi:hypothetical protein
MTRIINIGKRREVLWDDYLIDSNRTTATLRLHAPQPREVVMGHGEPWEGDGCIYHCIVPDDGLYRMYYVGCETMKPGGIVVICYAESTDGRTWVKPDLGICEFAGSKSNNIILDGRTAKFDNFSVFKDANPACKGDELYKGVGLDGNDHCLWCFTSPDGIHFRKAWQMTDQGAFDTLNVALWDRHSGRYFCYLRDFHVGSPGRVPNERIRDIRWMVSDDFRIWTTPVLLDFGAADDYPLYTNVVQPYYRADHVFVGFPSRYVEKREWTSNFDQMGGVDRRKKRMEAQLRYGLTITDCVFMSSRDGKRWRRFDEAFMTPGPEHEYNWVYGDCYPALGMIETESDLPHVPRELSMYVFEYHWGRRPEQLRRYAVRIDGFASYRATYAPCRLVTKPFVFAGKSLSLNFATSAAGYVRIRLTGEGTALESIELFGDSLDRTVEFEAGKLAALAGTPVEMEITMSDADIYSFRFA